MPDLSHAIEIPAAADVIYPLFSTGAGLRAWWAEDVTELPDGGVELGFFNRSTVYRLRPARMEDNHGATWQCETGQEWEGTRLIFELEPRRAATLLRFTHAGWPGVTEYFVSCNTTWGELMFRLRAAAEGRKPGPLFRATGVSY